jgi:hypothetical protein
MAKQVSKLKMTTDIPASVTTPDSVATSIGTLEFFDGVPTDGTVEKVYDNLDLTRGVDVFLNMLPGVSMYGMREGNRGEGSDRANKVAIFASLMDSRSLYLTPNTSTLYAWSFLDLYDGPTVIEAPTGMLGFFNDMWFHYMQDIGAAGPDQGKGGKYLVLPPGYQGDVPDGYFVVKSRTYGVWNFMRAEFKGNDPAPGAKNLEQNLKIYPLSRAGNPPPTEFIDVSTVAYNTIPPNDFSFYEQLNELIQQEPIESLDPERRGQAAAIGIVKGQPFNPDDRMKAILTEAAAIANATARAIVWHPREAAARIYPDTDSAWVMAYAGKDVFFEKDGARNLDARTMFHYAYTGVTPAMATPHVGKGSDYGIVYLDANKQAMNGAKTYKLTIPADPPVADFWAVTIYDSQTRSMLQTDQQFPTVGSQSDGFEQNADGSYDVYFAPEAPRGNENNWLQTIPGKSWFALLRMYGPLQPWIDKTWRPGEIEPQG